MDIENKGGILDRIHNPPDQEPKPVTVDAATKRKLAIQALREGRSWNEVKDEFEFDPGGSSKQTTVGRGNGGGGEDQPLSRPRAGKVYKPLEYDNLGNYSKRRDVVNPDTHVYRKPEVFIDVKSSASYRKPESPPDKYNTGSYEGKAADDQAWLREQQDKPKNRRRSPS